MPRRIILLFAFIGVAAALGMSWHVHSAAISGPDAPNLPDDIRALFELRDDAPDDDAAKTDAPTPIEIEFRFVSTDTLKTRFFTHADKDVPLVRGVMNEDGLFQFLSFTQGDRGCSIMQAPMHIVRPIDVVQSRVPFERNAGMHVLAGVEPNREERFYGFIYKGHATVRKDGRIHLYLDITHSGPTDFYAHLSDNATEFQVLNAKGSFVVESGQTCFVGGLKRRSIGRVGNALPFVGEIDYRLSGREVELDEELLFLATPRIVK